MNDSKVEYKGRVMITKEVLHDFLGLHSDVNVDGTLYDPIKGVLHVVFHSTEAIDGYTHEVREGHEVQAVTAGGEDPNYIPASWLLIHQTVQERLEQQWSESTTDVVESPHVLKRGDDQSGTK